MPIYCKAQKGSRPEQPPLSDRSGQSKQDRYSWQPHNKTGNTWLELFCQQPLEPAISLKMSPPSPTYTHHQTTSSRTVVYWMCVELNFNERYRPACVCICVCVCACACLSLCRFACVCLCAHVRMPTEQTTNKKSTSWQWQRSNTQSLQCYK